MLKEKIHSVIAPIATNIGYNPDLLMPQIAQRAARWDVAIPCFLIAKEQRCSPQDVATTLIEHITAQREHNPEIDNLIAKDGLQAIQWYLNIRISPQRLRTHVIEEITTQQEERWRSSTHQGTILVESPSPNTNKPLHLGHVRNMLLGNAVSNILSSVWYNVVRTEVVNDRGIHICKSMLAYQKFGEGAQPDKKSDHYVGDFYVAYAKYLQEHPEAEKEVSDMLQLREQGDPEVRALRQQMNDRALSWFAETYQRFNVTIEKRYFESDHYETGKEIVLAKHQEWLFTKDQKWNIVANLESVGLPNKVLLRADGTSIYITQDIALAEIRNNDFDLHSMIYVVWNEQQDHFTWLFAILQQLGYTRADRCHHLSYGMISLPDGKMKSREGNVVDADNLADEMHQQARQLLQERYPDLDATELQERAEAIAMSAIIFFMLKYEAAKDFVFDPQNSLSFEGETGPYIQYTAARCASLLRKKNTTTSPSNIHQRASDAAHQDKERALLVTLSRFPDIIHDAANSYDPSHVARYLLELTHTFNSYYHDVRILSGDESEAIRLIIVQAVRQTIHNASSLLDIRLLAEM